MSEVKVNKISPRTACGTVTMGDSGDTIALGCGASQTGFGRTGTVDWVTTPQTGTVTAASGKGYFVNTTSGGITVNLPAGAAGSIVSIADYLGTWATNNVTVSADGSEKIAGNTDDAVLKVNGQSVTLVYVDGTQGWLTTADSTENIQAIKYVTATVSGACNTLTTVCTNYKVATFTGPGTFCVSCAGNPQGSYQVDYLVVAGGGSGGSGAGAGGGAGGYRESPGAVSGCYTVSPLGVAPAAAIAVTVQGYPIAVGGGGASVTGAPGSGAIGNNGVASSFDTIPSAGGGAGGGSTSGTVPNVSADGGDGGSGGGGDFCTPGVGGTAPGGAGDTPNVTPDQGFPGGDGRHLGPSYSFTGGGGGALAAGQGDTGTPVVGGYGGVGGGGATSSINGTPTARAAGGGGEGTPGAAGSGGGGSGNPGCRPANMGTANTGGGGGGSQGCASSGAGGPGVVIIRYKFQ